MKALKVIAKKLFGRKLVPGDAYAVHHGAFCGEFFVFIRKVADKYHFLSLPKNQIRELPVSIFDFGITNAIIQHVPERIPKNIFVWCQKQFEFLEKQNEKPDNRHQQSSVSDLPHNKGELQP